MKQKIIIVFSVLLILLAVVLISYDLFRKSPTETATNVLTKQTNSLKKVDTSLIAYKQLQTFDAQIQNPKGIAVDEKNIFVCGNSEVIVFDKKGTKLSSFSIDSSAHCVEVKDGYVYLGIGPYIYQYSSNGKYISRFELFNEMGYITSISSDAEFVYAADAINKIVLKYSFGGNLLGKIGEKDSLRRPKGFVIPSLYFDMVAGGYGDIWVANTGYLRLENFSHSGSLRNMWGEASYHNEGFPGCCNPAHFCLLPDGSFVTYEKGLDKVKVFDPAGQFKHIVAAAGSFKGDADFILGRKNLVKDMATDQKGFIYILDAYNRICIFKEIE
jgi:hypothetical protein